MVNFLTLLCLQRQHKSVLAEDIYPYMSVFIVLVVATEILKIHQFRLKLCIYSRNDDSSSLVASSPGLEKSINILLTQAISDLFTRYLVLSFPFPLGNNKNEHSQPIYSMLQIDQF